MNYLVWKIVSRAVQKLNSGKDKRGEVNLLL